jgi:DNA repair photolyase
MFKGQNGKPTPTLNPVTGDVDHQCIYCWARPLAEKYQTFCRAGKMKSKKYEKGFDLQLHEDVLAKPIRGKNKTYSICLMGDLFAKSVPYDWIERVLEWCDKADKSNTFMFCTKNPAGYIRLNLYWLQVQNFHFGVTIETDIIEIGKRYSKAPSVQDRIALFSTLEAKHKYISVEPIMKFTDAANFAYKLWCCKVEYVYVGYDTKGNHMEEPSIEEFRKLIDELKRRSIEIRLKETRGFCE